MSKNCTEVLVPDSVEWSGYYSIGGVSVLIELDAMLNTEKMFLVHTW